MLFCFQFFLKLGQIYKKVNVRCSFGCWSPVTEDSLCSWCLAIRPTKGNSRNETTFMKHIFSSLFQGICHSEVTKWTYPDFSVSRWRTQGLNLIVDCATTQEAEIVFVVDASGSVGKRNFRKVRKFIQDVTDSFDVLQSKVRFPMVNNAGFAKDTWANKRTCQERMAYHCNSTFMLPNVPICVTQ